MHWILSLVAQVSPSDGGQWVYSVVSGVGGAGLATGILWKIHGEDRKTIQSLTDRLFNIADKAADLGKTATEVARNEPKDPELMAEMRELRELIRELKPR